MHQREHSAGVVIRTDKAPTLGEIGLLILEEQCKTLVVLDQRVVVDSAVTVTISIRAWTIKELVKVDVKRNIHLGLHLTNDVSLVILKEMNIADSDIKHFAEADCGWFDGVGVAIACVSNWRVSRHCVGHRCVAVRYIEHRLKWSFSFYERIDEKPNSQRNTHARRDGTYGHVHRHGCWC